MKINLQKIRKFIKEAAIFSAKDIQRLKPELFFKKIVLPSDFSVGEYKHLPHHMYELHSPHIKEPLGRMDFTDIKRKDVKYTFEGRDRKKVQIPMPEDDPESLYRKIDYSQVRKDLMGHGMGKKLYDLGIGAAKEEGVKQMHSDVLLSEKGKRMWDSLKRRYPDVINVNPRHVQHVVPYGVAHELDPFKEVKVTGKPMSLKEYGKWLEYKPGHSIGQLPVHPFEDRMKFDWAPKESDFHNVQQLMRYYHGN